MTISTKCYAAAAGAIVLLCAAACSVDSTGAPLRHDSASGTSDPTPAPSSTASAGGSAAPSTAGQDPKTFYTANVHPFLATNCGGCHDSAGPGPHWITPADASATYQLLFTLGYVSDTSVILTQGAHGGASTNYLTDAQKTTYRSWVDAELAARGGSSPPSVLDKLAGCMTDEATFDAIGLGTLTTTPRATENTNQCTGCNRAVCENCHSSDPQSGFVMAIGNTGLDASYTFQQTKRSSPPYMQKYFGVGTDGKPVASGALAAKSLSTQQDGPYTHPMFTIPPTVQANLDAWVSGVIQRYDSGACGN